MRRLPCAVALTLLVAGVLIGVSSTAGLADSARLTNTDSATVASAAPSQAPMPVARPHLKRPDVTLTPGKSVVELGKRVRLRGTVTPAGVARGERVVIKKRVGDRSWRVEGYARVGSDDRFLFLDKPTTPTSRTYRAVLRGTRHHVSDRSVKVGVAVAAWHKLAKLAYVDSRFVSTTVSVVNDQQKYRSSMKSRFPDPADNPTATAWVDYNLFGRCFAMKGAVGYDDRSPSGAVATFSLATDGATVTTVDSPPLFSRTPVTVNLNGVGRARFSFTRATPDGRPQLGLLAPRFLCTDLS